MLVKATCLYRECYTPRNAGGSTKVNVHMLKAPELQVVIEKKESSLQLDIIVEQANLTHRI
jgi:hypothetical protein